MCGELRFAGVSICLSGTYSLEDIQIFHVRCHFAAGREEHPQVGDLNLRRTRREPRGHEALARTCHVGDVCPYSGTPLCRLQAELPSPEEL